MQQGVVKIEFSEKAYSEFFYHLDRLAIDIKVYNSL